ncbi:DUF4150 domain-containing protein [Myxococcus sp. MISCRS1]|jgi:hypothetical protein|uniref:Uncharacterized protein n=1 Tax=Myxococcus fulvus TaxID=33 RepID=A0A511T633_MYXFU|nr:MULTISPECIES: PAAR-like domain-containing protein [Myxococcus]AKF86415.1 hypothetical protein MFUL124B02_26415 [Myxococcus fulvus 124B02]BDT35444.1 DUF4150 domain-containing protein [Myxococcus sp. MH1]MBZ4401692.1 DUF4150 domain-containing protein [Myxococcus sp. AS-1-15]MBZ4409417.1 DUF4150 domain-containing protein [Myxococcus sp. XM-1-1-1]MCK8501672.1 DUF4150 domain-containing protein [Myxococcus fulvus]
MSVTALGMTVVGEKSKHTVVPMAPNMCHTPAAPSPLPMPYPITGDSGSLSVKCSNIEIESKHVHSSFCKTGNMKGNEPGVALTKDITVAGVNRGVAWGLPVPAVTVHFEGKPVCVTGNVGFGDSR